MSAPHPQHHLRRQLVAHLQRLQRDGVWGLSLPLAAGDAPGAAASMPAPAAGRADDRAASPPNASASGSGAASMPAPATAAAGRGDKLPGSTPTATASGAGAAAPTPPPDTAAAAGAGSADDAAASPPNASASGAGGGSPLGATEAQALVCRACRLHETRNNVVFGVGAADARLMFVGEGPGRDEDLQGEPFVGRAGRLLTKIIEAMGFERHEVYIANAVKCRPPSNRDPRADEIDACRHFLMRQVELIDPEVVVLLGRSAVNAVLGLQTPMSRLRGNFRDWNGTRVMCTYHPAYLLRNPSAKSMVWEDMRLVRDVLGRGTAD